MFVSCNRHSLLTVILIVTLLRVTNAASITSRGCDIGEGDETFGYCEMYINLIWNPSQYPVVCLDGTSGIQSGGPFRRIGCRTESPAYFRWTWGNIAGTNFRMYGFGPGEDAILGVGTGALLTSSFLSAYTGSCSGSDEHSTCCSGVRYDDNDVTCCGRYALEGFPNHECCRYADGANGSAIYNTNTHLCCGEGVLLRDNATICTPVVPPVFIPANGTDYVLAIGALLEIEDNNDLFAGLFGIIAALLILGVILWTIFLIRRKEYKPITVDNATRVPADDMNIHIHQHNNDGSKESHVTTTDEEKAEVVKKKTKSHP